MKYRNSKKYLAAALAAMTLCTAAPMMTGVEVQAADFQEDSKFSVSELVEQVVDAAETQTSRIRQEKAEIARAEAAKKAKEEAEKKAEEEARKAQEAAKKAEEEARKAEEAARKAEEERLAKRQEIVDYALQFEGNPYVYGGTSLTNGADCSGFVMSVFANFGYSLPRTAADQAAASTERTLEELEAGDLVFYGGWGIGHVALYIGDGKIIHASTESTGIIISDYDYDQPVMYGTYLE